MAAVTAWRQSFALLRTRRFGTFWFASLLSNIGTWAQQVAQPWLLLSLGASSFIIGLDSFAMSAPVWLLTLTGGALADRADRRNVITVFQSIQMLCPTLIVVLLLTHSIAPWMIIAFSTVVGVTDALSMPSFSSIVPSIVEPEQLPAGLALNSTQFNISRIAGPALAGLLMTSIGAVGAFVTSAASYLPFIAVAFVVLPKKADAQPLTAALQLGKPLEGVREIFAMPRLRGAILTTFTTGLLCGPLVTFTPVLVREEFGGDAGGFSAAVAAFGVGGLLGGLALLGVDPGRDRRSFSSLFAVAYGVVVILAAANRWLWLLPGVMALAGAAQVLTNTSANTVLQAAAGPGLRGRAVSLYMLSLRGGLALGSLLVGATVSVLGVRKGLALNGAAALVAQLLISRLWLRADAERQT